MRTCSDRVTCGDGTQALDVRGVGRLKTEEAYARLADAEAETTNAILHVTC